MKQNPWLLKSLVCGFWYTHRSKDTVLSQSQDGDDARHTQKSFQLKAPRSYWFRSFSRYGGLINIMGLFGVCTLVHSHNFDQPPHMTSCTSMSRGLSRLTLNNTLGTQKAHEHKHFYRDIPTLLGLIIISGYIWDIPILIFAYVLVWVPY